MSYNPAHHSNSGQSKQIVGDRTAGRKHSDIVRKINFTSMAIKAENRSDSGYLYKLFDGKQFSVRNEILMSGNSIGYGINLKADRVVYVVKGILYVKDNDRNQVKLSTGQSFSAPRGFAHGYATSGTEDVELIIIESPNYAKNWESKEEETVSAGDVSRLTNKDPEFVPRSDETRKKTREQAQELARRRGGGVSPVSDNLKRSNFNANSSGSLSVNPQPINPAILGDD